VQAELAPDGLGPYAVGAKTGGSMTDASRDNRTLPVIIWYPVDPGTTGELVDYPLSGGAIYLQSNVALWNAPIASVPSMPLIVFSHGYGGENTQSISLCETLASHGFIVVAPNHTGNTSSDSSASDAQVAFDRPRDISFVIDNMLARNANPSNFFYGHVSTSLFGVTGHSFGGYTAVTMAAGSPDVEGAILPLFQPDTRVDAIAPIAGVTTYHTDAQLASIQIPTLFLGGTADTMVPIDPNTTRPMGLVESRDLYRADVVGATHTHFANICDIANALIAIGYTPDTWESIGAGALIQPYNDTCSETAFPIEEATRLQNLYVVSFFLRHLLNDQRYAKYLTVPYAEENEPDVAFYLRDPLTCPASGVGDDDLDGVCNLIDLCPGFDDLLDADLDGIPDGCDSCAIDIGNDADADGTCANVDRCDGIFNLDNSDTNGDGIGDYCQCGDVNGDGNSDNFDSLLIKRYDLGLSTGSSYDPALCDVSGDGLCDNFDSLLVKRNDLGLSVGSSFRAMCEPTSNFAARSSIRTSPRIRSARDRAWGR